MINLADNELLMRCSCHSSEHIAFLIHDDDCWYLTVMLDHFSFWKRLRIGLRYIFVPQTIKYGMTAELVLRSEDIDELVKFISRRRSTGGSDHATDRANA